MYYSEEFKASIRKEHEDSGLSNYALAKKYNLNPNTVYRWIKEPNGRIKSEETIRKDRERDKLRARDEAYTRINFNVSPHVWKKFLEVCTLNGTDGSSVLLEYAKEFVEREKGEK